MAKEELNKTHNDVDDLEPISDYHYENIFNMFKTDDGFYGYNILKTINFPEDIQPTMFEFVKIDRKLSWTYLSYLEYGTIKLWWLICLANHIQNPVQFPTEGMRVKIIKKQYVAQILQQLSNLNDG